MHSYAMDEFLLSESFVQQNRSESPGVFVCERKREKKKQFVLRSTAKKSACFFFLAFFFRRLQTKHWIENERKWTA